MVTSSLLSQAFIVSGSSPEPPRQVSLRVCHSDISASTSPPLSPSPSPPARAGWGGGEAWEHAGEKGDGEKLHPAAHAVLSSGALPRFSF